jgi:hypothetical protein
MRPSLAAVLRNPISAIDVALTTASGFLFLILLSINKTTTGLAIQQDCETCHAIE